VQGEYFKRRTNGFKKEWVTKGKEGTTMSSCVEGKRGGGPPQSGKGNVLFPATTEED